MSRTNQRWRDGTRKLYLAAILGIFALVCGYAVYAGLIYRATSGSDVGFLVNIAISALAFGSFFAATTLVWLGVRLRRPALQPVSIDAFQSARDRKRTKGQKVA